MIQIALKLLSSAVLLLLGYILFHLGLISLMEGKHILDPYIDTRFADNYSPEKFDSIEVGMKHDQVFELIGEPLSIGMGFEDASNLNYHYTHDGKFKELNLESGQYLCRDYAWYGSSVEMNDDSVVVSVFRRWVYD